MSPRKITINLRVVYRKFPGVLRRDASLDAGGDEAYMFHCNWQEIPSVETDPWAMRNRFLAWPVEGWRDFVARYGNFHRFGFASLAAFSQWQRLLRRAMTTPATDWTSRLGAEFAKAPLETLQSRFRVSFDLRGGSPVAEIAVNSALDAMIATLHVDAVNGARFRECKRPDCPNAPFALESNHDRIYCSYECAHLMAVRASRQRKAAKRISKSGTQTQAARVAKGQK